MVWMTADVFRWHLNYFRSPGPQFHRLALFIIPALAAFACLYSAIRRSRLWKYEPYLFALIIVAACLSYETRAFLVIAATFLASSAAGRFAVRRLGIKLNGPLESVTLAFGSGAGLLILLLTIAGMLGLFYAPLFVTILLLPLLLLRYDTGQTLLDFRTLFDRWRSADSIRHPLAGIAMVFAFLALICALMLTLAPSIAFDPVAVHIPSAQFYTQTHALRPVTGLDYSYYPQGFEMLWTFAYALAGQPGAQLMSALFFPLFLLILACLARACGLDRGATFLALVCAATLPFLHWSGSAMKNDLALTFFELLTLYSAVRWLQDMNFRWIAAGAFFLAQSFSIKHVALFAAIPLTLLFAYAIWRQPKSARAAALVVAILLVLAGFWPLRAYLLTGNPVAPSHLSSVTGVFRIYTRQPPMSRAQTFFYAPMLVLFHGQDTFESPLPNPAGILFFAFAPLALLGVPVRPLTRAQIACTVFAAVYLVYWAAILVKVRYAIAPFAILAILFAAWIKQFYDSGGADRFRKFSILGVETYCLLIALMGLMIVGNNAPQLAYFAGRVDKPGYLRAAMQAYGPVDFVRRAAPGQTPIFAVENMARAYSPDPFHFQGIWCPDDAPCSAADVVRNARRSGARYLIFPENGSVPADAIAQLGSPECIYRDAHFRVYHLTRDPAQTLR